MKRTVRKCDKPDHLVPMNRLHAAGKFLSRFRREEDGVLVVFGIYVFILVLMVGGIGIDLMRFERDRTHLQYTLDRAVLAAADLDQTLDPQAVVEDYFAKAGMGEHLASVTVDQGLSYRTVSADATATIQTQFMHMTGVDTLIAPAAGTAEERIDGVEISLVLDVSGSMNSNSRLYNLKIAAKDFVDEMVDNSEDGKLSISIVPYATQVAASGEFLDAFTVTNEHSYSHCVNFETADFNETGIDMTQELQRTMHFDPWTWDPWDDHEGRASGQLVGRPICENSADRQMMVLQKNKTTLKNFISSLSADGNTSIDLGMKWGTALLDPSLQGAVDALISSGTVSSDFDARPHGYGDGETLKVIVLMTDGQNTSQYYLDQDYRSGDSNIWWNDEAEKYSVYIGLDVDDEDNDGVTDEPLFYWPFDDSWKDHAYGEGTYDETNYEYSCVSYRRSGSCRRYQTIATTVTVTEVGTAEIVTYPDLWAYTAMERHVKYFYEPWMYNDQAWDDWYYDIRNAIGSTTKDSRARAVCDAAKAEQIIVFTIGFEAPTSGKAVLQDCASSPSHFFDVQGLQISEAFSSIASSIRKLRLTQ